MSLAARVKIAVQNAGVAITDVAIGDESTKATWKVVPVSLQSAAQPTINAFDPADPTHEQNELDAGVKGYMDTERVFSALVAAIIDTYSPPFTVAKYQAARTKILNYYKAQPWKP